MLWCYHPLQLDAKTTGRGHQLSQLNVCCMSQHTWVNRWQMFLMEIESIAEWHCQCSIKKNHFIFMWMSFAEVESIVKCRLLAIERLPSASSHTIGFLLHVRAPKINGFGYKLLSPYFYLFFYFCCKYSGTLWLANGNKQQQHREIVRISVHFHHYFSFCWDFRCSLSWAIFNFDINCVELYNQLPCERKWTGISDKIKEN